MTGVVRLAIGVSALSLMAATAHAQSAGAAPAARYPDLSQVFVFFFLMLGPIKIIAPFALMTAGADSAAQRKLATHAFLISTVTIAIAALIGHTVLQNWHVSVGALLLAGGIILFLASLKQVLQQYALPEETLMRAPDAARNTPATRMAFPTIVTPYGIAIVIIILATNPNAAYAAAVIAMLVVVMVLNLLAMLFARQILKTVGMMPLQIVGAVLSVLQVALGIQMILWALDLLGIVKNMFS
jgi:multiple antibiotic resistance protein